MWVRLPPPVLMLTFNNKLVGVNSMTATHYCETCSKKTTHVVLTGIKGTEVEGMTALKCVVCGAIIPITVKEK